MITIIPFPFFLFGGFGIPRIYAPAIAYMFYHHIQFIVKFPFRFF